MSGKSLYERLGGYDAIFAVTNDLLDGMEKTRNWAGTGRIAARTA